MKNMKNNLSNSLKFYKSKKLFLILLICLMGGLSNSGLALTTSIEDVKDVEKVTDYSNYSYVEPKGVLDTVGYFDLGVHIKDAKGNPVVEELIEVYSPSKGVNLSKSSFETDKEGFSELGVKFEPGIKEIKFVFNTPKGEFYKTVEVISEAEKELIDKQVDVINDINFSEKSDAILPTLETIPEIYKNNFEQGVSEYNTYVDDAVQTVSDLGEQNVSIKKVFDMYKFLTKSSYVFVSYNEIAKSIESHYELINTVNVFVKNDEKLSNDKDVSEILTSLNKHKLDLDNLVSNLEKSMYDLGTLDFKEYDDGSAVISKVRGDYESLKIFYKVISDDIVDESEKILSVYNQ